MTAQIAAPPGVVPLVSVAGSDTHTAVATVNEFYAGAELYCRPLAEDFRFKYVGIGDAELSFRRLQIDGYLRGTIAADSGVVVQWITRGSARIATESGHAAGPTLFPTGDPFPVEYDNIDQRLVHIGDTLLRDVAAEQYLEAVVLTFKTSVVPEPAAVARWRASIARATAALRTDGTRSLAWEYAKRDVVRALLQLYPLQADPLPAGWDGHRNLRLRAAVEYIHGHAQEPVTVADVAAAVGLSIRSIQEIFQRHLHRSPTGYARDVRLDRAHHQLQSPEPDASVAMVARQWGFGHMGRFSAAYVERFGEYPRETLRAHRRPNDDTRGTSPGS